MKPLVKYCKAYCPNYKHCTRTECHRKLGFYNGGALTMMSAQEGYKWDRVLQNRLDNERVEELVNAYGFRRRRIV